MAMTKAAFVMRFMLIRLPGCACLHGVRGRDTCEGLAVWDSLVEGAAFSVILFHTSDTLVSNSLSMLRLDPRFGVGIAGQIRRRIALLRSEEHTSELQSH